MGHAEVDSANAELGSPGGDRTGDLERGLSLVICQHFGIQPGQPVRRPQRLRQRFLRSESGSLRRHRPLSLGRSKNPPDETRPSLDRLGKAIDVTDIDANPNDHQPGIMQARSVIMNKHLIIWAYSTVTDLARLRG
jgi:hypothetical protein